MRLVSVEWNKGALVDPIGEASRCYEDAGCGEGNKGAELHCDFKPSVQNNIFKIKRYLIIDLCSIRVQVVGTMKKRPWRNGPSGVVVTLSLDAELAAQAECDIRGHAAIEADTRLGIYLPCALVAEDLRPIHDWLNAHLGVQAVDVVFAATEPQLISEPEPLIQ